MEIYDSELSLLETIWGNEGISASDIAKKLNISINWSRTTTYTVISKCIEKKLVRREEPGYKCYSLISRKDVQKSKISVLLNRMFDNSVLQFFSAFSENSSMSDEEKEKLKKMLDDIE